MLLSILMASVMCLYFSMQEEDILEHTKVHIPKTTTKQKITTMYHMIAFVASKCMHVLYSGG